jgi:prephenate dehydratase
MTYNSIAYQGTNGAYAHEACLAVFPKMRSVGYLTIEQALNAVKNKEAIAAIIPVENSIAGRVADVHFLLPASNLFIVGEHYHKIEHNLLANKSAKLKDITEVHSHIQALSQCSNFLHKLKAEQVVQANTAIAAQKISAQKDITKAVIASKIAAEIYGLQILKPNIQNDQKNTTRFLILAAESAVCEPDSQVITTFVFKVKNRPAALYKALGGFATNGINMTKLESFFSSGDFVAANFYVDVEAHPNDKGFKFALEELGYFSETIKILGTYPAHSFRGGCE